VVLPTLCDYVINWLHKKIYSERVHVIVAFEVLTSVFTKSTIFWDINAV
jgi:hypothetical protein